MNLFARKTLVVLVVAALAGCGGGGSSGGSPAAPAQPVTLSATPAAFTFPLNDNTPEPVSVTRSAGTFASLGLSVGDPTVVGVTATVLTGSTATFSVIPIAHGATTITTTDGTGVSTTVSITTASCGRPPSILAAQQVVPASGATGVSPSIGQVYFVAYVVTGVAASGNLHMSVGAHGTLEGGQLVAATLPAGTVLPTPPPLPGPYTSTIVSATVPALAAGQQYRTQLYNDTCQGADVAGTFST